MMHSCEVAVALPPPIQGTALLLELGTLIIEGRSSQLNKSSTISRVSKRKDDTTCTSYGRAANGSEKQEGKTADDVRSRLLATKIINAKYFQKLHLKTTCEDGEKSKNIQSVPQSVVDQPVKTVSHSLLQGQAEALWKEQIPLCIDVLLAPECGVCLGPLILLERWTMSVHCKGSSPTNHITSQWLLNAVRSQLHFSQLSAWSAKLRQEQSAKKEESPTERQRKLSRETCNFKKYESNCDEEELLKQERAGNKKLNVIYNIKIAADDYRNVGFKSEPTKHAFPVTDIGSNVVLMVILEALPRADEIPVIQCMCSNPSSTLKRRRSRDTSNTADEALAHTLANVCLLGEGGGHSSSSDSGYKEQPNSLMDDLKERLKSNAFYTEVGAINPDKGCSSGISRKLSAYSMPSSSDLLYSPPTPRGTTPDNRAVTCTSPNLDDTIKLTLCNYITKGECLYQDGKVPSLNIVDANYLVVDDRMQTPCGKKGKHRCNCDEESDHGSHLKESNDLSSSKPSGVHHRLVENCKSMDERRTKETVRYLKRLKKEARVRQMREGCQSNREHSESKADGMEKDSRHNDLNVMDKGGNVTHTSNTAQNSNYEVNTISRIPKLYSSVNKVLEHQPTTSIPILQASRFDHAMRFGGYRNCKPFHASVSSKDNTQVEKELECACSSVGCDQMASVKTCKNEMKIHQLVDNNFNIDTSELNLKSTCQTLTGSCNFCNSDDNYRPVVKKMISSCTQTDDFRCDCGKTLVPKCFECSGSIETEGYESYHGRMKRSWGSHNLVGIDKSALLLEAIERPSRLSESQREEVDAMVSCDNKPGEDAGECDVFNNKETCSNNQVIENNCDNSVVRHKDNKLYASCNHLSSDIDLSSAAPTSSSDIQTNTHSENTTDKTSFVKYTFAQNIDKAINFIRRPKLKRFMPIVDRLDKIVMERSEEKRKTQIVMSNNNNTDIKELMDDKNSSFDLLEGVSEADRTLSSTDEFSDCSKISNENTFCGNQPLVYEQGYRGNDIRGCMEIKHGEKHSFEEKERSCKHFRSDSETHQTETIESNISSSNQYIKQDVCREIENPHLNIQVDHYTVPSTSEMDKFRWRLDSAASMVFHSRTGLPLTSSPAPLRRGKSSFDYDSSINSVSSIKSALYGTDLEPEQCSSLCSPGSSPGSPLFWDCSSPPLLTENASTVISGKDSFNFMPTSYSSIAHLSKQSKKNKFRHGTTSGLLGSFEESVLNGRLEPAATVVGFTAEIGASGSFCPQHLKLPVTVFFYSLGDNTTSAPYLGHINLGRRGYNVPKAGTIQVTLFNPHGTVVRMFVVMYDMADMPPNSKTFLRQKTLCVPAVCSVQSSKQDPHALRYLIHLRFLTSKSGKVYLHTDIRIIVSRRADMDTAQTLKPAISSSEQNAKKKTVETGIFKRRYPKDTNKTSLSNGISDNHAAKVITKQPNMFTLSNDLFSGKSNGDSFHDNAQNGMFSQCHDDLAEDKKDGRIRRRSDSLDGLPKELSYELRSFTYGPDNPKYSPR